MGEYDQVYKEKEEEFNIPVYDVEYTNIQGKRAKAQISAKSDEHAFNQLEDLLKKVGYLPSSIKNLNLTAKEADFKACEFWIVLK